MPLFFPTFADVDKQSMAVNGSGMFGRKSSETWKPWKYSHHIKVVKEVEKFKEEVKLKNVMESTKRYNVTVFIAK